jgi:GNAT superfamily N-acetyltransferase
MTIRSGGPSDVDAVLAMLDGAVAWLTEHGRTGQWGSEPFSAQEKRVSSIREKLSADEVWIAELDGRPAGALTLSPRHLPYVPAPDEPERYITLLVSDRGFAGRGVGSALLAHARQRAVAAGVHLLRVDCYAGSGGELVEYYCRNGFRRVAPFTVGAWPGQLLAQRV